MNNLFFRYKNIGCLILLAYSLSVLVYYIAHIIRPFSSNIDHIFIYTLESLLLQLSLHALYAIGAFCILFGVKSRGAIIILTGGIGFLVSSIFDFLLVKTYPHLFYLLYCLFHILVMMFFSLNWLKKIGWVTVLSSCWVVLVFLAHSILKCELII